MHPLPSVTLANNLLNIPPTRENLRELAIVHFVQPAISTSPSLASPCIPRRWLALMRILVTRHPIPSPRPVEPQSLPEPREQSRPRFSSAEGGACFSTPDGGVPTWKGPSLRPRAPPVVIRASCNRHKRRVRMDCGDRYIHTHIQGCIVLGGGGFCQTTVEHDQLGGICCVSRVHFGSRVLAVGGGRV